MTLRTCFVCIQLGVCCDFGVCITCVCFGCRLVLLAACYCGVCVSFTCMFVLIGLLLIRRSVGICFACCKCLCGHCV